jgi:hypothetical protein
MIELFYSKMCELIVYLYNDTGNDHTESSDIVEYSLFENISGGKRTGRLIW